MLLLKPEAAGRWVGWKLRGRGVPSELWRVRWWSRATAVRLRSWHKPHRNARGDDAVRRAQEDRVIRWLL